MRRFYAVLMFRDIETDVHGTALHQFGQVNITYFYNIETYQLDKQTPWYGTVTTNFPINSKNGASNSTLGYCKM